jgi:flavin reductase (DIM6/NTAB) family NADH-FMN oxidoreductase RutF
MSKQIWKPGTMLYPLPAVMVSCGTMEESNILTVAWTGTICTDPAMTYISIRPERYSYDIIKKSGEFVINLTTKDLAFATDWCGVKCGKDVDKFKEMKLTKEKANFVSCPLIKESPVSIECKVEEIKELGSHHMFIAKVLSVDIDDRYLDENSRFCFEKASPIAYSHGQYFALGELIGKFGYSVKKP